MHASIDMPIQVSAVTGELSLHRAEGPRVISTAREMIDYGFQLMSLRIEAGYEKAADEVKQRWEGEVDAYILHAGHNFSPVSGSELLLIKDVQDALLLQRQRERGEAHLSKDATLGVWLDTGIMAEKYLKQAA